MADTQTRMQGIEYNVILTFTPDIGVEEIASEFARHFKFEQEVAEQILRSAPVVFLRHMSKKDIKAIKPSLLELSRLGVEFTISPRLPKNIPSIIWPFQPTFAATTEGEVVKAINFQWAGSAIVCPGCGEVFVFRPIGKPSLKIEEDAPPQLVAAPQPVAAPAPMQTPPPESPKTTPKPVPPEPSKAAPTVAPTPPPRDKIVSAGRKEEVKTPLKGKEPATLGRRPHRAPQPEPELEVEPEVELTPLEEVEEIQELTEAEEVVALEESPAETAEVAPAEEVVDLSGPDMEIIPLEEPLEEPVKEPPKPAPKKTREPAPKQAPPTVKLPTAPKQPPTAAKPKPVEKPELEPVTKGEARAAKQAASRGVPPGEALYSVFLNRIVSREKQEQAAKILASVRNCSLSEAREQVKKVIIPVIRDVSKEEADNCLKKFTEIGLTGKTTKKKQSK